MRKKILKYSLYFLIAFSILLLLGYILLQQPKIQNYLKDKILTIIEEEYNAKWTIGNIKVDFFDEISMNDILFLDQQSDTLLAASYLHIDIGILNLLGSEIKIDKVEINDLRSKIYLLPEEQMNYSFLIPEKKENDGTTSPWTFDLQNVVLSNPSIDFENGELQVLYRQKYFDAEIDKFDVNNQIIRLDHLITEQGKLSLAISQKSNNQDSLDLTISEDFILPDLGWEFGLDNLVIKDYQFKYRQEDDQLTFDDVNLSAEQLNYVENELLGEFNEVSFTIDGYPQLKSLKGRFALDKDILQLEKIDLSTPSDFFSIEGLNYAINAQEANTKNIALSLSQETIRLFEKYLPNNFKWNQLEEIKLNAQALNFVDGNLESSEINLTSGDLLQLNADLVLQNLLNGPLNFDGDINTLNVKLRSLDALIKDFELPDSLQQYENLSLKGKIKGSMDELFMSNLKVEIDNTLRGEFNGNIGNLTDIENIYLDLRLDDFRSEIRQLPIPKSSTIAIDSLGKIFFDGSLKGNRSELTINGQLLTDIGSVTMNSIVAFPGEIKDMSYEGDVKLNQFQLGTFLKNQDIQKVSFDLSFAGSGINRDNINTTIKGAVSEFSYLNYDYQKINIDASVVKSKIQGEVSINDPNISARYNGVTNLDTIKSNFDFSLKVDTLNLKELGFLNDQLGMKMNIETKFNIPLSKGEKGTINIYDLKMKNESGSFEDDTIMVTASKSQDSTFITIDGKSLVFDLEGQFGIRDLIPAFKHQIQPYLPTSLKDSTEIVYESKSINIKGQINTLQPLDLILPKQLIQAKKIKIDSRFNFVDQIMDGRIEVDSFTYDAIIIDKSSYQFNLEKGIGYLNADAINASYKDFQVPVFKLENSMDNGIVKNKILIRNNEEETLYNINTRIDYFSEDITLSLLDSLVLNKERWSSNDENVIRYRKDNIDAENFGINKSNQSLEINSIPNKPNSFNVSFIDFDLGQLLPIIGNNSTILEGDLNGDIDLMDVLNNFYFLADLNVKEIIVDSTAVGNLGLKMDIDPKASIVKTNFNLKGKLNDVNGSGTYKIKSNALDFKANIEKMQLKLLDPFLTKIMKESEGTIDGMVDVKGSLEKPEILGEMNLDKVSTTLVPNNVVYKFEDHTITFNNNTIDVGEVKITDAKNNVATIGGKIYHNFLDDIRLDMNLRASDFIFLNTTDKDNPVFNGKVILGANATLVGPPELLDVNVTAKTLKETLVRLSPFSGSDVIMDESFISYGKPEDFENTKVDYLLKAGRQFPFKVNVNLAANTNAKMIFVLDPVSGDKIECRGEGDLRIIINPNGQQEIYGTYTVQEGSYSFSYGDFVTKNFKIAQGGTIKFNGDPLKAELNIDAIYNVYTSAYELIKNEVSLDESEIATAKKRTNVEVLLNLNGNLEQPDLNLDIRIPELTTSTLFSSVERKLIELRNNPNELNNQVFGLLIFDSFILSENSSAGFDNVGSNIALSSISNLVSSQLNRLARNTIKGVDINVNVNSYESNYVNGGSGGNVTELGVKVSKQLFNDRLKLTAGGNFDLEGSTVGGSYSSFIGDFVLEYNLTANGQYKIKVFSKSNYDRLLNENANRNGVSLYFNKTFDSKTDGK